MKRTVNLCLLFSNLTCFCCFGGNATMISYEVADLGDGQWEYTYDVSNLNLIVNGQPGAIEEFSIWFDANLYANLEVTTANPSLNTWDQIILQPEPVLGDPGAYDALASESVTGILKGETIEGFSVSFDWLGTGIPSSQYYQIIDPITFETIEEGFTIPEPTALVMLGIGGLGLFQRRK